MNNQSQLKRSAEEEVTKEMTEENKHQFPAAFQEAFEYIKTHQPVFPKKYYKTQQAAVKQKVNALWHQNPELPPKEVVRNVLENLPDWLPPANVLEVTQIVLEEWQALCKTEVHA